MGSYSLGMEISIMNFKIHGSPSSGNPISLFYCVPDLVRYVMCRYLMLVWHSKSREVLRSGSIKVMDIKFSDVSFTMILSVEAMKLVIGK